jgi:hypothetical protein
MSDADDEFRVRLGRIGNRRGRKAIGYVKRVRKIANKAAIGRAHPTSGFTGSRIGRGYAHGTVSASRRSAGQRRVVIKARIVRIKVGNTSAVRAHLRYVQRDGVTREGGPGQLYDEVTTAPMPRRLPSEARATAISFVLSWLRKILPKSSTSSRSSAT